MNREEKQVEINQAEVSRSETSQTEINIDEKNQVKIIKVESKQDATNHGVKKQDIINIVDNGSKEVSQDDRNAKERLYDKIPISLKALDIVIGVLIALLVIILLYFIIRRFS